MNIQTKKRKSLIHHKRQWKNSYLQKSSKNKICKQRKKQILPMIPFNKVPCNLKPFLLNPNLVNQLIKKNNMVMSVSPSGTLQMTPIKPLVYYKSSCKVSNVLPSGTLQMTPVNMPPSYYKSSCKVPKCSQKKKSNCAIFKGKEKLITGKNNELSNNVKEINSSDNFVAPKKNTIHETNLNASIKKRIAHLKKNQNPNLKSKLKIEKEDLRRFISGSEASEIFGYSSFTFRNWAQSGHIRFVRKGGQGSRLYDKYDIIAYLKTLGCLDEKKKIFGIFKLKNSENIENFKEEIKKKYPGIKFYIQFTNPHRLKNLINYTCKKGKKEYEKKKKMKEEFDDKNRSLFNEVMKNILSDNVSILVTNNKRCLKWCDEYSLKMILKRFDTKIMYE